MRLASCARHAFTCAARHARIPFGPLPRTARALTTAGCERSPVSPLVLLLDLDETLVRAKVAGVHHGRKIIPDFEVTIDMDDGIVCEVSVRPGVSAFFEWIRERRRTGYIVGPWLFAQGHAKYVEAILSRLNPSGDIFERRLLTKFDCTRPRTPGYVLKDLTRVPCGDSGSEPPLSRMILVDNNVISGILYPRNVLMVRDWLGIGAPDHELARVSRDLDALMAGVRDAAEDDPRDYVDRLVDSSPKHADFQRRLDDLHRILESEPPKETPLKAVLSRIWQEASHLKRDFLDLQSHER